MNELERNAVIVAVAVLMISTCTAAWYANSSHNQIVELETEIQRLSDEVEPYLEEIATLERTIEVIVMERTMYIELSFAEIQRLRVELNATKQLLAEMNQTIWRSN